MTAADGGPAAPEHPPGHDDSLGPYTHPDGQDRSRATIIHVLAGLQPLFFPLPDIAVGALWFAWRRNRFVAGHAQCAVGMSLSFYLGLVVFITLAGGLTLASGIAGIVLAVVIGATGIVWAVVLRIKHAIQAARGRAPRRYFLGIPLGRLPHFEA